MIFYAVRSRNELKVIWYWLRTASKIPVDINLEENKEKQQGDHSTIS